MPDYLRALQAVVAPGQTIEPEVGARRGEDPFGVDVSQDVHDVIISGNTVQVPIRPEWAADVTQLVPESDRVHNFMAGRNTQKFYLTMTTTGNVGNLLEQDLGFTAHSVIVDNPTTSWVFFPSLSRWVPPGCMGMVFNLPSGSQKAHAQFGLPVGAAALSASTVGAWALIEFVEAILQPVPGTLHT